MIGIFIVNVCKSPFYIIQIEKQERENVYICKRDRENILKNTRNLSHLVFDLLTNYEIAIDECKGSPIYPEGSGVF